MTASTSPDHPTNPRPGPSGTRPARKKRDMSAQGLTVDDICTELGIHRRRTWRH
ncbi:hypothetical protein ACIBEJ_06900 [Nonomuraea sp. NPDC050790]|uniref:hypothetical protein n=1 Tax=Nonomuraea sp. NPDC050790 TaxID=3364371 RepID=UPI0037A60828